MIRFKAFGVCFSLPLLTLVFPILASRLGMHGLALPLMAAMGVHELSHLAAAKLARIHISEIRLMPFGGSARIENPYQLPAKQLIIAAAAGPAANFGFTLLLAACAHWGFIKPALAAQLIQPNLILLLFNLLPVLPLDGGRIAFCLLRPFLGEKRALKTGIWLGRVLAALLILLAVYSGFRTGKWNLSFLLAAVFIIASEPDERSALSRSRIQQLHDLVVSDGANGPVRLFQANSELSAHKALAWLRPRENAWFIVIRNGVPLGLLDAHALMMQLLESNAPDASLGEMPLYRLSPNENSGAATVSHSIHLSE